MSVKVSTRLKKGFGKRRPFEQEVESFRDRKDAIGFLRQEFGSIDGSTDEQWLADMVRYGYEITFEEIKK